jgi:hypothetical protein
MPCFCTGHTKQSQLMHSCSDAAFIHQQCPCIAALDIVLCSCKETHPDPDAWRMPHVQVRMLRSEVQELRASKPLGKAAAKEAKQKMASLRQRLQQCLGDINRSGTPCAEPGPPAESV